MPISLRTIAGAGIILQVAATSAAATGLCITPVPLVDSANPHTRELIYDATSFPGSAWPVFYAFGRLDARMFNEHGQLTRPKEFPADLINDKFVTESSGRVIGTKRYGRQVYVQNPANGQFVSLTGTETQAIGLVSMASWATNWNATLVATSMGLFELTNGASTPTLKRMELADPDAIGPLAYIFDLPRNHATALVTADGRLLIVDTVKRVHEISGIQIKKGQWLLRVSEIANSNKLLVEGSHQAWIVSTREQTEAALPDQAREITTLKHDGSGILQYYKAVGQYLTYGTPDRWFGGGPALLRLDDDLTAVEGSRGLSDHPFIQDVPSQNLVVVQTFKRLYKYDGKGLLEPIAGSLDSEIGGFPWVHDVTSQLKVIVITISGLHELTLEGKLVRVAPPPELEGAKFFKLAEMPASQIAVVFTDRGIFAVDQAGTFSHIRGDDHIDLGMVGPSLVKRIPVRETLFFSTYANAGQFMIVDTGKTQQDACATIQ